MKLEICDHCNKEINDEYEGDVIWNVINDVGYMPDEKLLCKECSNKLLAMIRDFIDGEEV